MAAHTPGPWSINDWPQVNSDISIGAVGTPLVARVPLRDVSINQQKANAYLIAAAPQLRAFAQKVAALHPEDFDLDKNLGFDLAREAGQLVAKADGAT